MRQQPVTASGHLSQVLRVAGCLVEINQCVQQMRFAPRQRAAVRSSHPRVRGGEFRDQFVGVTDRYLGGSCYAEKREERCEKKPARATVVQHGTRLLWPPPLPNNQ